MLTVKNLKTYFPIRKGLFQQTVGHVKAVDDVSFELKKGETLGLVGESGCGKTTTGRSILQLIPPTSGKVIFDGRNISQAPDYIMRPRRRDMQIVFQDPYGSLNPRMTIRSIVEEALIVQNEGTAAERFQRVREVLYKVGLDDTCIYRYPHEFSGGQRQRVCIARALVLNPKFIVLDEPISALDVSIQSQIINLLAKLRDEMELTYLFISHDLSVVEYLSDRVAVMYLGQIVETATSKELYVQPRHPYTQALLSSVPTMDEAKRARRVVLEGDVPSPINPPQGCRFHPRCPICMEICKREPPPLIQISETHSVSCHAVDQP